MNNSEFTYIYLSKITLYQTRLLHLTDHNHKDQAIEAGKNPKFGNHPSGSQGGRSPAPAPLFVAMRPQSGGFTVSSFRPPLLCFITPFHAASMGDWGFFSPRRSRKQGRIVFFSPRRRRKDRVLASSLLPPPPPQQPVQSPLGFGGRGLERDEESEGLVAVNLFNDFCVIINFFNGMRVKVLWDVM